MRISTGLLAGKLTVYGTDSCSWTKKQLDYLNNKGIAYTYVNCEKNGCPDFVSGFPTMDRDGKILIGYKEI